jgi:hypothetical protein
MHDASAVKVVLSDRERPFIFEDLDRMRSGVGELVDHFKREF